MATFFKSFQFLFTILIVLELGLPSRGTIFQPAAWRSSGGKKKRKAGGKKAHLSILVMLLHFAFQIITVSYITSFTTSIYGTQNQKKI